MDAPDEVVGIGIGQVGQRAVGPHPAGVRAGVAVAESLVVARDRQGQCVASVAQRDQARLATLQAFLDDDQAGPRRRLDRAEGLLERVAHGHALAGGEAVRLDDDTTPVPGQLAGERARFGGRVERAGACHRDPGGGRDLVAERLARLDPGSRRARPEHRDAGRLARIGHAGRQRRLRTDDDELRSDRPGRGDDRRPVERVDIGETADSRFGGHRVAAGPDVHRVHARFHAQPPGQRMLAGTRADDEDPGRHHEAGAAHAGIPGRRRIGRNARSIVCVRSGPTETSTIGTPAWLSMADT